MTKKNIVIFLIVLLIILDTFGVVSVMGNFIVVSAVLVFILIQSYNRKIKSGTYFFLSFLLIVFCSVSLLLKNQNVAERLGIWCYFFLLEGLLVASMEYKRDGQNKIINSTRAIVNEFVNSLKKIIYK